MKEVNLKVSAGSAQSSIRTRWTFKAETGGERHAGWVNNTTYSGLKMMGKVYNPFLGQEKIRKAEKQFSISDMLE